MSRAFLKDPEPGDPLCPECGTPGEGVGSTTLDAQLPAGLRAPLGGTAYYCVSSGCRTAYFTAWGAAVPAASLRSPAYPKDPEAPLCPCFGIRAATLVAEAREGKKEGVRALVERANGPEARCTLSCPDGRPCIPRALRLFRESFHAP